MIPRARTCPPGASTALFLEGGDEWKMVRRLIGEQPLFYQQFDGRAAKTLVDRSVAARNDPGWPGIRRIGVILDAEEDLREAEALVQLVFSTLGLPGPSTLGTVEEGDGWRYGAFLLPDNQSLGSSETLLLRTVETPLLQCIDSFFA